MNQCHFLGNLTRDVEVRKTQADKSVANFGIAVNTYIKKGVQETLFLDCECWDTSAEMVAKYFKKGDPIIVHGRLRLETWDDKNGGGKRSKVKLRMEKFEFVPGAKKADGGGDSDGGDEPGRDQADEAPAPAKATRGRKAAAAVADDEIPF